ncbi:MAG: hypothetical protein NTY86_13645, partial [Deltaproteobacteria bacterium]|nr:hypothetical protein [Deltaproteobacteria bacterium]
MLDQFFFGSKASEFFVGKNPGIEIIHHVRRRVRMEFENLFRSGELGSLELKNRIVMLPMGTILCGEWGEVTKGL